MSESRILSTRAWYRILTVCIVIGATGFGLFIYGLQILPNQLPQELIPPFDPNNVGAYSSALSKYQVQSLGFKYIIAGVGIVVSSFGLIGLVYCRYELATPAILPV